MRRVTDLLVFEARPFSLLGTPPDNPQNTGRNHYRVKSVSRQPEGKNSVKGALYADCMQKPLAETAKKYIIELYVFVLHNYIKKEVGKWLTSI